MRNKLWTTASENSNTKRVFKREISSRDEIIPIYGEMSLTVYTFLPR